MASVDTGAGRVEVRATPLALMLYEQEFAGRSMVSDLLGGDGEWSVESGRWEALTRALWACKLSHTLMPVGDYTKDQIREIAAKIGLPVAKKKDSQEICFVPDQDYASFIQNETGIVAPKGNFVNTKGEILGTHEGITHYTVGQRRGLGLPMGHRVFVLEIRPETNEVVVGENEEVFAKVVKANKVNYMAIPPLELGEELSCTAKIRYGHKGSPCVIKRTGEDEITCTFPDGVRAPTPGQAVVFYVDGCVGGGGTITEAER